MDSTNNKKPIGATLVVGAGIAGNDLPNVLLATEFLRGVAYTNEASRADAERNPSPSSTARQKDTAAPLGVPANPQSLIPNYQLLITNTRVLVLGGGNVAIDAAMSAVRLGAAWIGMTCLESRAKMPAHEWEVNDAEEEGIEVFPSRTFKEVTNKNGRVSGVRTVNVNFRGFVEGRPDFDELPNTEEVIAADVMIFAIGQRPEANCLKQVKTQRGGRVIVDSETLTTNVPGIFAGGDAVSGTTFIVAAIAAGHRAAHPLATISKNPNHKQAS